MMWGGMKTQLRSSTTFSHQVASGVLEIKAWHVDPDKFERAQLAAIKAFRDVIFDGKP